MMGDAGKTMLKLAEDLDKKAAIQSIKDMHSAITDLKEEYTKRIKELEEEPGYTMGGSASERIEQLEAEVESWKNSYERASKENGELASKLAAIYESQRLHEEEDRCNDPNCSP